MKNFEHNTKHGLENGLEKNSESSDFFDPINSEYHPLSEEIRNEIRSITEKDKAEENTGFIASLIRKMLPA